MRGINDAWPRANAWATSWAVGNIQTAESCCCARKSFLTSTFFFASIFIIRSAWAAGNQGKVECSRRILGVVVVFVITIGKLEFP